MREKCFETAMALLWRETLVLLVLVALGGCVEEVRGISGLKPEQPPAVRPGCATLTSLEPTLRWQAFPAKETAEPGLSGVTYDLKIWVAAHDAPGNLVYAREGLPEPTHTVQEPLQPATPYFWSVRAEFLLHGAPRVTDWGQQLAVSIRTKDTKPGELLGSDFIEHQHYRYYCFNTP